jgi:Flp pilus assembly CpaF family ATPase
MKSEDLQNTFKKALNQGKVLHPQNIFSLYSTRSILSIEKEKFTHWYENTVNFKSFIPYINDTSLNEIILHSPDLLQIEQGGSMTSIHLPKSLDSDYQLSFDILCLKELIDWNYSEPYVSFYLKLHGVNFRATLIHFSCLSSLHSKLFLRRIRKNTFSLKNFNMDQEYTNLAIDLVKNRKNIIVSGQTSGGKTTFLNCLIDIIPEEEHIILFEETKELFRKSPTTTSFLSGNKNNKKSLTQYLSYALRMKPDRMILGEIRSQEALSFLLNMNTGHPGLMATLHSNTASEALTRLAWLFCFYCQKEHFSYDLVLKMICKNIDYVFHVENKKIKQLIKVMGAEDEIPYFQNVDPTEIS